MAGLDGLEWGGSDIDGPTARQLARWREAEARHRGADAGRHHAPAGDRPPLASLDPEAAFAALERAAWLDVMKLGGDLIESGHRDAVPPAADQAASVAHLAATVADQVGHVRRHLAAAQAATSPDSLAFNLRHAANHAESVAEHAGRLMDVLAAYDPRVGDELAALDEAMGDGAAGEGAAQRTRCLDGAEALDQLGRQAAGITFRHHYDLEGP